MGLRTHLHDRSMFQENSTKTWSQRCAGLAWMLGLSLLFTGSLLYGGEDGSTVICRTQMTQESYRLGDTVELQTFVVENQGEDQLATEWKVWLEFPSSSDLPPASVINDGSDGSVELPGSFYWDLVEAGLGELFQVDQHVVDSLSGTVVLGVRLLSPETGELLCESFSPFTIGAQ